MKMFKLSESQLKNKSILDCAAGASSFTAHLNSKGFQVKALDILYDQNPILLKKKCQEHMHALINALKEIEKEFSWTYFNDLKELENHRCQSCQEFYEDYRNNPKNYHKGDLTQLSYPNNSFDLILSSHLLFIYDHRLDLDFHLNAVQEMLRVSNDELRIYPLVKHQRKKSKYVENVIEEFEDVARVKIIKVDYQFRKGANEMLLFKKY